MTTITIERIEQYANDPRMCNVNDEIRQIARLALASLTAEPVAWIVHSRGGDQLTTDANYVANAEGMGGIHSTPVYAAPPAPVSVPDEVTAEDCPAFVKYDVVDADEAWARGFNVCRAAMLQGSQPVSNRDELPPGIKPAPELDSVAINGKSLPSNSPVIRDCWCHTCRPVTMGDMRFVVCPDCGNKRCPHANDHNNACTGSNEPGQAGSAYPSAPQQEVK